MFVKFEFILKYYSQTIHSITLQRTGSDHTVRLQTFHPFSIAMITSEVAAFRLIYGAFVVRFTTQNVRQLAALRRNGFGLVAFAEKNNKKVNSTVQ